MSVANEHSICRNALVASFITGYILCGVSVGTLAAISVDRLLALLLGQTNYNFKAKLRDRYYLLGCTHCFFSSVVLESRDKLVVRYHSNISVSGNRSLFLHKDFL